MTVRELIVHLQMAARHRSAKCATGLDAPVVLSTYRLGEGTVDEDIGVVASRLTGDQMVVYVCNRRRCSP
jgi:hypothetical protein